MAFRQRNDSKNDSSITTNAKLAKFKIVKLDLRFNNLITLPNGVFSQMKYLRILLLKGNFLTTMSSDLFPESDSELRKLSLSLNKISSLQKGFADNLLNLEILDLGNNRLTQLEKPAFVMLFRMFMKINVSDNPFTCDCQQFWYIEKDLSNETEIYSSNINVNYTLNTTILANVEYPDNLKCKDNNVSKHLKCVFEGCPFDNNYIFEYCS